MKRNYKYIYHYLRYSFVIYLLLVPLVVIGLYLELPRQSVAYVFAFVGILILIIPAFFILPGIIYDNYKPSYLGLNYIQFKYELFLGLTGGFGPIYVFFKYHDQELKEYFENGT